MNLITERLIVEAHKDIGVCEATRNSGPEIDGWLRRVGQKPGAPWCAAWAWCKLDDAIKAIGYTNHLPPTASVHRLFELAHQHHAWWPQPGPGCIFGIDHGEGRWPLRDRARRARRRPGHDRGQHEPQGGARGEVGLGADSHAGRVRPWLPGPRHAAGGTGVLRSASRKRIGGASGKIDIPPI